MTRLEEIKKLDADGLAKVIWQFQRSKFSVRKIKEWLDTYDIILHNGERIMKIVNIDTSIDFCD